jgi:hypothetical protein
VTRICRCKLIVVVPVDRRRSIFIWNTAEFGCLGAVGHPTRGVAEGGCVTQSTQAACSQSRSSLQSVLRLHGVPSPCHRHARRR